MQLCSTIFQNNTQTNISYYRLFLFTTNDDPCTNDPESLQTVKEYLKLMENNNVDIELFPLVFEENKFDYHKFYSESIRFDKEDFESGLLNGVEKIE